MSACRATPRATSPLWRVQRRCRVARLTCDWIPGAPSLAQCRERLSVIRGRGTARPGGVSVESSGVMPRQSSTLTGPDRATDLGVHLDGSHQPLSSHQPHLTRVGHGIPAQTRRPGPAPARCWGAGPAARPCVVPEWVRGRLTSCPCGARAWPAAIDGTGVSCGGGRPAAEWRVAGVTGWRGGVRVCRTGEAAGRLGLFDVL